MTSAVAYYRVSTQRQGRSGWASRRSERQSPASPKPRASPSCTNSPRSRPAREPMRSIAGRSSPAALARLARRSARCGGQARPPLARRCLHRRTDGPARAVHRGGTRRRRRSLHAAPLCGAGREGAAADLGAHPSRPRLAQSHRHKARQSDQHGRSAAKGREISIREADRFAQTVLPIMRQFRAPASPASVASPLP